MCMNMQGKNGNFNQDGRLEIVLLTCTRPPSIHLLLHWWEFYLFFPRLFSLKISFLIAAWDSHLFMPSKADGTSSNVFFCVENYSTLSVSCLNWLENIPTVFIL